MKPDLVDGSSSRHASSPGEAALRHLAAPIALVAGLVWLILARTRGRFFAASFAVVIALLLSYACYRYSRRGAVRVRVAALLGIYVALTVLFGAVHYAIFLSRPDLYSFADAIREGKILEEFDADYSQVLSRSRALYVLALAHEHPEKTMEAVRARVFFANPSRELISEERGFVALEGAARIRLRHDELLIGKDVVHLYWVEVRSEGLEFEMGGDALAELAIPSARAASRLHSAASQAEMLAALESLIDAVRVERADGLRKIRDEIRGRPDWNVLDFTYFSAVTITTLGYGDILPNSTSTRFVVMVNSVAGVFFAAFALLVIWPPKKNEPGGPV